MVDQLNTKLPIFVVLLFVLGGSPSSIFSQVVLSEIMFDAPGSEYYEEFIELYNLSETETIDLWGYQIGDQTEIDSLIDNGEGLLLAPLTYALILDPGYTGNSSVYDALIPPEALVITISDNAFGTSGLRNDPPDTVILQNATGYILAYFAYSSGNANGYSEEKVRLSEGDDTSNWQDSESFLGTPGFTNSVQPEDSDIGIAEITTDPSTLPYGSPLNLNIRIENLGLTVSQGCNLIIALGECQSGLPDTIIAEENAHAIQPGSSVEIANYFENFPAGSHEIIAWHTLVDQNPANDTLSLVLKGGYPPGSIIINEIFPRPLTDQTEWIELYNRSSFDIELFGFKISDADTSSPTEITDSCTTIISSEFALIAQDSSIFNLVIPSDVTTIVLNSEWPILNNDGDTPTIFDAAGGLQDAVPYTDWTIPSGISLERVYINGESDDPSNWQPSYDESGGTPGRANSYGSQIEPSSKGTVLFNPDPFDPQRHGNLEIEVTMPQKANSVAIKVFDLAGRSLKQIFDGNIPPSPLLWNGQDSDSRILPPGLYIIFIEFRDQSGDRIQIVKKTLVIAGRL